MRACCRGCRGGRRRASAATRAHSRVAGSTPSTRSVQHRSDADDRQRAAAAQLELSLEQPQERAGPPPSATTPAGTPDGSTPTEATVAPAASSISSLESLPGRPPSGPSSSPTIRTCSGWMPRRHRCAKYQRAESDLSVRPISMCLASLVTRAPGEPGVERRGLAELRRRRAARRGACSRSRASTAVEQLGDLRLRRIRPLRLRDQVDLAAVESLRDDPGLAARARRGARPSAPPRGRARRPPASEAVRRCDELDARRRARETPPSRG